MLELVKWDGPALDGTRQDHHGGMFCARVGDMRVHCTALSGSALWSFVCSFVVCCRARLVQALVIPWAVLHDLWRFGCVLIELRAMVCGRLYGYAVVWSEGVGGVRLAYEVMYANLHDCPGPFLRSSVTSGNDLRRFGHATYAFWEVLTSVLRVFTF